MQHVHSTLGGPIAAFDWYDQGFKTSGLYQVPTGTEHMVHAHSHSREDIPTAYNRRRHYLVAVSALLEPIHDAVHSRYCTELAWHRGCGPAATCLPAV